MPRSHALLLLALASLASACARGGSSSPAGPVRGGATSAREVVQEMQGEWGGKLYRTLTFVQNNTRYTSTGGEETSQWMEYQSVPGRLRIEFLPASSGSGMLMRDDTIRTFDAGKLAATQPQIHPLLLLSADVYALPVDRTMRAMDSIKIDTTIVRRDQWQGMPVYVVGAAAGDTSASQLWVDVDSLLVRRILQRAVTPAGRAIVTDYHFTYQTVDGVPVPREIVFLRNGKPYWREEYTAVRVNPPLPDGLFDPTRWTDPPAVPSAVP